MFKRSLTFIRHPLRPRREASPQQVAPSEPVEGPRQRAERRVIASLDEALNASLAAGDYRQVQVDWNAVA